MAKRKRLSSQSEMCAESGCIEPTFSRGMCKSHYNRDYRRRYDNPHGTSHVGVVRVAAKGWGSL